MLTRLTSSHRRGPLNHRTRLRTALRQPLPNSGSLREAAGGEIGHLVMMGFVKNADMGLGRDQEQTLTHTHSLTQTGFSLCM